jgi:heme ABC exporter ATP-binding subunit CcmA
LTPAPLVARGLEKRFGRTAALRGIDFELAPGASLAVLGPNGAGKSTLLRLAAGLASPTAGTLELDGHATTHRAARGRVGYVGHATLLYPTLTARENLLFAARLHGVRDPGPRCDALLAEEGLAGVGGRPAGDFSRGMAQRLAIARGLVHDPDLVLLDEPFTGLDRASAERLGTRLARLHEGGRSVVLVTHDFERAVQVSGAAFVLSQGRITARAEVLAAGTRELERAWLEASAEL